MTDPIVVAIAAPGAMGSGVGRRLAAFGALARTSLEGRSEASARRAREAGLAIVRTDDELVAGADLVLSIVPSAQAAAFAERLAGPLSRAARKPVYADCNAISPRTAEAIAARIAPTGCPFADVGIFGRPPAADSEAGPTFYACGPGAGAFLRLGAYGLQVEPLDGPVGVASTLKLIHAGITKGTTAVGAAMFLTASHHGLEAALLRQMQRGHPQLAAWLAHQMPDMWPKAYRWIGEMEELEEFVDPASPTRDLYRVMARMYERLAKEFAEKGDEFERLSRAF